MDAMATEEERMVNATENVRGWELRGRVLQERKGGNSSAKTRPAGKWGGKRYSAGNPNGSKEKEVTAKKVRRRRRVFLAADMSPAGIMSTSMAYTMREDSKKLAVGAMRKLLNELDVVTWPMYEPWFEKVDCGVQGILDKLVAMKAGFFLGAPVDCGGGHTYTEEIHAWRAEHKLPSDTWTIVKE